ncbi:cobalamin-binding protein [Taibaiella soli]|uniref:Cobalamin-binding protein n=2 Tax=Taibaiella soli TaxID=1649169 RepID=A0A2W2B737_9BACT|nr:cobalamin-binding protein [Taibaiella soli]
MMGREMEINFPPKRIVSLVPSQTELLYDLGLDEEVVGITKFCLHPESWFRSKKRIGGTKQVHYEEIAALQPDLILANKEENTQEIVDKLSAQFPVWVSNITSLQESLEMITEVGKITGTEEKAIAIANEIRGKFDALAKASRPLRVAYFIWRNPWMSVGADTFISHMIAEIGWGNVFADKVRYPEISLEELAHANPDLVLLSSEPYPFKEKHIAEIQSVVPNAKILLVDGEMFSWYGSRLKYAPAYFKQLTADRQ